MGLMSERKKPDDLELLFGSKNLKDGSIDDEAMMSELKRMQDLASHLGSDSDFQPDKSEVEMLVARVDRAIDQLRPAGSFVVRRKLSVMPWLRRVTATAVIVLLAGTGFLAYLEHRAASKTPTLDDVGYEAVLMSLQKPDVVAAAIGTDYQALDDNTIDQLLYDYTSNARFSAGERLLDDLSEDELKYLEKNFNVGDIL